MKDNGSKLNETWRENKPSFLVLLSQLFLSEYVAHLLVRVPLSSLALLSFSACFLRSVLKVHPGTSASEYGRSQQLQWKKRFWWMMSMKNVEEADRVKGDGEEVDGVDIVGQ